MDSGEPVMAKAEGEGDTSDIPTKLIDVWTQQRMDLAID